MTRTFTQNNKPVNNTFHKQLLVAEYIFQTTLLCNGSGNISVYIKPGFGDVNVGANKLWTKVNNEWKYFTSVKSLLK